MAEVRTGESMSAFTAPSAGNPVLVIASAH